MKAIAYFLKLLLKDTAKVIWGLIVLLLFYLGVVAVMSVIGWIAKWFCPSLMTSNAFLAIGVIVTLVLMMIIGFCMIVHSMIQSLVRYFKRIWLVAKYRAEKK